MEMVRTYIEKPLASPVFKSLEILALSTWLEFGKDFWFDENYCN